MHVLLSFLWCVRCGRYEGRSSRGLYREHVRVDVGRVEEPRHRLHEHEEGDHHQEQTVDEARQDLHAAVSVGGEGGWSGVNQTIRTGIMHAVFF